MYIKTQPHKGTHLSASNIGLPQGLPTSAEHRLDNWRSRFPPVPASDLKVNLKFLARVADGSALPKHDRHAQAVFHDLLFHEAYDLFVEVFSAYQQILKTCAEADDVPCKPTLVLRLPNDWKPKAPAEMNEALRRAQAQRVEVVLPRGSVASEAVCEAVATLLKSGAKELAIHAELAKPSVVVQAIAGSDSLSSLELGRSKDGRFSSTKKESYVPLVTAAMRRPTLRHLGIHDSSLLEPLTPVIKKQRKDGPALSSVFLALDGEGLPDGSATRHVAAFMAVIKKFEHLTAVSARASDIHWVGLILDGVLKPLNGHPTLTRVDFNCSGLDHCGEIVLQAFSLAIQFTGSCRSLTHFSWKSNGFKSDMRAATERFANYKCFSELSETVTTVLTDPSCPLRVFIFNGFFLPYGGMLSFARSLASNTSLITVDLSNCIVDLPVTRIAMDSLKDNYTLKHLVFPANPHNYYLQSEGMVVSGFSQVGAAGVNQAIPDHVPRNFKLQMYEWTGEKNWARARGKFTPELKAHADEINTAPQALLDRNQRKLRWQKDGVQIMPHSAVYLQDTSATTTTTTSTTTTTTTTGATTTTTVVAPRESTRKRRDTSES